MCELGRLIQDSSTPAFDADRLGAERVRILEAPGALTPMTESRPLFAAVLAGSFMLHLVGLFLLNRLEQAPRTGQEATVEIPVDLVSDPIKTNGPANQSAAKPASHSGQQKAQAKPTSQHARPPAEMPATQVKTAAQAQAAPPKPTVAPTPKPAAQSAAKPAPTKQPTMQAGAPRQAAPQPPNLPAQTAPNPSTMAGLQMEAAHPIPTPASSPFGIMGDDDPLLRAVAVPRPTAGGDQALSYKTIVFGMLEVAKQFPEDARARGAQGTATIYFEVNDNGSAKNIRLLKSSGDTELDAESLAVVLRASPFPKPPQGAQRAFAADIEFDPAER
jgi:TonB family protein